MWKSKSTPITVELVLDVRREIVAGNPRAEIALRHGVTLRWVEKIVTLCRKETECKAIPPKRAALPRAEAIEACKKSILSGKSMTAAGQLNNVNWRHALRARDELIAEGRHIPVVHQWRALSSELSERLNLEITDLDQSSRSIARRLGCALHTVQRRRDRWLRDNPDARFPNCKCGLPKSHVGFCRHHPGTRAAVDSGLVAGRTFKWIANDTGSSIPYVSDRAKLLTADQRRIRAEMQKQYPLIRKRRKAKRAIMGSPNIDRIFSRIRQAMPTGLDPALRDDAISEMYIAVMEGRVKLEDIAKEARKFSGKQIGEFASKWGARSLDEVLFDDGDMTLLDTIVDPSSLEWAEEMGA